MGKHVLESSTKDIEYLHKHLDIQRWSARVKHNVAACEDCFGLLEISREYTQAMDRQKRQIDHVIDDMEANLVSH